MAELTQKIKDILNGTATSTITGFLNRRGLNNMFLHDVSPLRLGMKRMAGIAYTLRFLPQRKDKSSPLGSAQQTAMEQCPPGHVLMIDSRGDARAASAGDLFIGRLAARGCAGIVTDGGFRDSEGVLKTGLPAYHQRPVSPPSGIAHLPYDIGLPIACGGVAVFPGDIIVGDCDGVVVIPPDLLEEIATECEAQNIFDEFAEAEVAKGRSLIGLFPNQDEKCKADFAAWKKARGLS
ncbi:MAG: ribonuclease activity regulator RraA [Acetobacteraceae bacterium]|nr:ribonuclease activity regulator RraA [Acetobacteraceae bacterium]